MKYKGKYVLYGRMPHPMVHMTGRRVSRTESSDLVHWTEPEVVMERDVEDLPYAQYYSLSAFPYEDMVLGALERMDFAPDVLDCELAFSHDSKHWQRGRTRPAFIPRGNEGSWDSAWVNLPSSGPIRYGNNLWFYYSGRSAAHGASYPLNAGGVGLSVLRLDGFASLRAEGKEACVLTPPMHWPGENLMVNFDPRPDQRMYYGTSVGALKVEVRTANGTAIAGYTKDECVPVTETTNPRADEVMRTVTWQSGRSLSALSGERICLAFYFHDGHLYSFRAGDGRITPPAYD